MENRLRPLSGAGGKNLHYQHSDQADPCRFRDISSRCGNRSVARFVSACAAMLTLVAPTVARHGAWLASHREWGSGMHEDGYGLAADDEVESVAGFARFVQRVTTLANARLWWVLDGHEVVGGVALRTAKTANVLQ